MLHGPNGRQIVRMRRLRRILRGARVGRPRAPVGSSQSNTTPYRFSTGPMKSQIWEINSTVIVYLLVLINQFFRIIVLSGHPIQSHPASDTLPAPEQERGSGNDKAAKDQLLRPAPADLPEYVPPKPPADEDSGKAAKYQCTECHDK